MSEQDENYDTTAEEEFLVVIIDRKEGSAKVDRHVSRPDAERIAQNFYTSQRYTVLLVPELEAVQ